jgi:galactokinase
MLETQELAEEFKNKYGNFKTEIFFAPGRINLIGEHIDYNGGFVLPAAISLGITAIVRRRDDAIIRIYAKDFDEETIIHHQEIFDFKNENSWVKYISATLQVLKDSGTQLAGADILIASDLPLGAGLSSSAALECLIAYIFNPDYYQQHRIQLALDAQKAERQYVGVNCGIMDQFAVANGRKNKALLLNCNNLEHTYSTADFNPYQIIIINSNKPRALAESKYNERRNECEQALRILQQYDIAEDLCHVHEISLAYLENDVLYKRAKHAITENNRVQLAIEFLNNNEINAFGQILTRSHQSLADDYEVSCLELDTIVQHATHHPACIGARMTGAGFGGCCIALVEKDKTEDFIDFVAKKYSENTTLNASFYVCEIDDGVRKIE